MASERGAADYDDQKLLRLFLEESEELLERFNSSLLELEKDPDDRELVHEIFRATHSLKSESAQAGFPGLSSIAHRLEDVFEKLRSGELALDRKLMNAILPASDLLHELMGRISRGEGEGNIDSTAVMADLARAAGLETGSSVPPGAPASRPGAAELLSLSTLERYRVLEALDQGHRVFRVELELEPETEMCYPRAYLVLNNLESTTNVIKSVPDLTAPADEDRRFARFALLFTTEKPADVVRRAWAVSQVREVGLDSWTAETVEESRLALAASSETVFPGGRSPQGRARAQSASARGSRPRGAGGARSESSSVRVDPKKLTEIRQLVGELISWKSRLAGLTEMLGKPAQQERLRDEMEQARDSLEKISGGLQQAIMETSMVPISVLFSKLPRLVRDLSRQLGKDVELKIEGQETEIDRTVVEVLSEPLTHIIRNALDHGIEPAAERLAAGKPAGGCVTISAQPLGGRIVIEVTDDGRGVDVDGIRRKTGAPPDMSDGEVIQYIFSPGFSTKEDVTALSGRGVGMDVVATEIRGTLRGDVQVNSQAGAGTRVSIYLPLSLAILEALVMRSRGYDYAVAVRDIEETVRVRLRAAGGEELVEYRGERIPALRLERLLYGNGELRHPPAGSTLPHAALDAPLGQGDALLDASGLTPEREEVEENGVVIRHKSSRVCLVVDELVEEQDAVIKPVSELLNARGLFAGVSVMGDGRVLFVLNTVRLVELAARLRDPAMG
jgi:two-component system chemotaxis sensor kinase CheA